MPRSLTAPKPPTAEQPSPACLPELHRRVIEARMRVGHLRRSGAGGAELLFARTDLVVARLAMLRPARVFQLYLQRRGPLMAAGLAYRLFFAISALLVVGFAALGIVIAGNEALKTLIVDALGRTVPGLIGSPEDGSGLVQGETLFAETQGLGLTLVVAVLVMLTTSLAWVGGMREAMRGMFALEPVVGNPVLLRIKDLGTLLLLGTVMLVTTALGVLANNTLGALLALLKLGAVSQVLTQVAGFAVMILLDILVAVVLLRSASAIEMPRRSLLQGAALAGIGSTLLRTFSAQLLAGVSRNPLLLPFAVILALFVWFFFLSQVYLIATAWCAVGTADAATDAERQLYAKGGSLRQRSRRRRRG